MALSKQIVGMHYRHPDHYIVGREKVREYAVAVKNDDPAYHDEKVAAALGHKALPAPLTFISATRLSPRSSTPPTSASMTCRSSRWIRC